MYCSQCGKKTNSGDKFCSDCGHELKITDNNYKSSHPTDGRFFSEQFIRDFNDYLIQSNGIVFENYTFQDIKYLQNYMMNHQFPIDSFPAILMLEIPDHVKNREEIENTKIFDHLFLSPLWDEFIKKFPGIDVRPKYNREDIITYLSNRFFEEKDLKLVNKIVDEYNLDSEQFLRGALGAITADPRKLEKIVLDKKKAQEIHSFLTKESGIHLKYYFYEGLLVIDIERANSKITKIWVSIMSLQQWNATLENALHYYPHRSKITNYLRENFDLPLTTKVAGVTFEGRQKTISEIYFKFDKLTMNPDNEFNGIQLFHKAPYGKNEDQSMDLGFIPKEQVNKVKYLMEYFELECLLVDVTGGGGDFNYGVKIIIYVKSLETEVYDQVGYTRWENTDLITDGESYEYKNDMRELVSSKSNGPTYIFKKYLEAKEFSLFDTVEHCRWGFGKVIGINPPRQITVSFEDKEIRKIEVPSSCLKKI